MADPQSCLTAAVAAAMGGMGPFEPKPALAVAVSGGSDSMALAILIRDWARPRDGSVTALVVDHGLRAASAEEASITILRLAELGIPARLLPLTNLRHGSALAERARIMRYDVLADACRQAGILHLLLGHHAADQVETLVMRALRGSRTHGLAGMSAVRETGGLRLLRPLLGIQPARLRAFLTARAVDWIEDPSNRDTRALRPRLRQRLEAASATGPRLTQALSAVGRHRAREEAETAVELAHRATIRPEGFALLSPGRIGAAALARLVRTIGGASYPPSPKQIDDLAQEPRPTTVAGVRILSAGRLGDGWLIVREEAAIAEPIAASPNAVWDNRFRVIAPSDVPRGVTVGMLGPDAARFRDRPGLPSAVLRTLPAIRYDKILAAVPHLGYVAGDDVVPMTVLFYPSGPIAGACFVPSP
jgi:tRNA(Ile)-lysidine synthase